MKDLIHKSIDNNGIKKIKPEGTNDEDDLEWSRCLPHAYLPSEDELAAHEKDISNLIAVSPEKNAEAAEEDNHETRRSYTLLTDDSSEPFLEGGFVHWTDLPSHVKVDAFELSHPELFKPVPEKNEDPKKDFNLLNINAYVSNWGILDDQSKDTLNRFLSSEFNTNCNRYGCKNKDDFERNLLLLVGLRNWEMTNGANIVMGNLKVSYKYYPHQVKNRLLDPRTSRQECIEFKKKNDVERLFKDFHAQIYLFEANETYKNCSEMSSEYVTKAKEFFDGNVKFLLSCLNSKQIHSFIYSHEFSCPSILNMQVHPHTHAIVFFKKGTGSPNIEENRVFTDRELKKKPAIIKKYSDLEKFIDYMRKSYSLSETYEREYRDENARDINFKARELMRNLLYVIKDPVTYKHYKRFGYRLLPKRGDMDWTHPKLIKTKKKKTKTKAQLS